MFNTGQSCESLVTSLESLTSGLRTGCSIERIYVHESIHDDFVARFVEITRTYRLGDPFKKSTTLGPVVSLQSAARIRQQVHDAGTLDSVYWADKTVRQGANLVLPETGFEYAAEGTTCVGPMVLTNVDHSGSRSETRAEARHGRHDGRNVWPCGCNHGGQGR